VRRRQEHRTRISLSLIRERKKNFASSSPSFRAPLFLAVLAPDQGARDDRVGLDVFAGVPSVPQLADEGAGLLVVVAADDGLDGLGGGLGVVEGNAAVDWGLAIGMRGKRVDCKTYGNRWCTTWVSMMPWKRWRPTKPKSRSTVARAPLTKVQCLASKWCTSGWLWCR